MDSQPQADHGPSSFPIDPQFFDGDDRISYSKLDKKFLLVADDGSEYEFDDALRRWIPALDDELARQQQAAYKVHGVDEEETVEDMRRKRKKEYVNGEDDNGRAAKAPKKAKAPPPPRPNTAVYVTGLPHDVTVDEVAKVFSHKCGVIAEEIDSGRPRIKLYTDENGTFKGDALIVFFKAPSVDMAITLLDDTDFRYTDLGGSGKMRVMAADSSYKKTKAGEGGGGGNADGKGDKEAERERARASARDKAKIIKKTQKLDARLADWDDDDTAMMYDTAPKPQKLVVLKHMFTLQELEEDPAALLDIKEDIREECTKLGEVTNVVLYDLEEEGVASVRFREEEAATECVRIMNGRSFAGQTVVAYLSDGKEGFKRSKTKAQEEADGYGN